MYKIEMCGNVLMSGGGQGENEEMIISLKPYFGFSLQNRSVFYAVVRYCSDVSLNL